MTLAEFKPLDFELSLLTPPRKKAKTTCSTNPLESQQYPGSGGLLLLSGDDGDDETQRNSSNNDNPQETASPTAATSENECSPNIHSPSEGERERSFHNDSGIASVEGTEREGTGEASTGTQKYSVMDQSGNTKSFHETLQDAKDLLSEAQTCLEEMNSLSVKNAILKNALVMVGADL